MTTPIVDPRESAFFATDPSRRITEQPPPVQVPDYRASSRRLTELGVALGAAFIVYRKYISGRLKNEPPPPMNEDRYRHVKGIIRRSPFWVQLSVPIIREAVELGNINQLTPGELEVIAQSYAEDLGDYINDSSSQALIEGFEDQLQKRWSDTVAWHRAASAFGLDRQQMRAFMQSVMDTQEQTNFDLLPDKAQAFLDKALTERADRIGGHEVWQAKSAGKAIAWLTQQKNGIIPTDAQKQWITAEDEMVCPQCGPLHKKRIGLDERWKTPDGNEYWAPGVHPNCRCDIRLLYPEIVNDPDQMVLVRKDAPGDPHDRDKRGRFARVESRVKDVAPDPVLEGFLQELKTVGAEAEQVREKITAPTSRAKIAAPKARTKIDAPGREKISAPRAAIDSPTTRRQQIDAPTKTRRKKIREKQILVLLPDGRVATRPSAGVDHIYDAEVARTYVFAHNYYRELGVDTGTADAQPHYRDQVIDFDFGQNPFPASTPVVRGYRYDDSPSSVMFDTEDLYDDRADWDTPTGASFAREYSDAWHDWYGQLNVNKALYANQLSPSETQRIMESAGNEAQLTHEARVHRIINADEGSPVYHAFVNYMENNKLDNTMYDDTSSAKLRGVTDEMKTAGYVMHTPTVFILNDLDPESGIIDPDGGEVAVAGKYRVVDNHYVSTIMELGTSRPPDIKGINFVYLESVFDSDDQGVLNYEEDYDFNANDMTYRDNPQNFPGIGYWGENHEDEF